MDVSDRWGVKRFAKSFYTRQQAPLANLEYKPHYRKNLPHIQPPGATLFVTCRLAGSLPRAVLDRLREEAERSEKTVLSSAPESEQARLLYRERRRAFGRLDLALDKADSGPKWLHRPEVAAIVMDSLHFLNGRLYDLGAFCIMSNHIHLVFRPLRGEDGEQVPLQRILHSLKRHTARETNKVLQRSGKFWQYESYDHVVRHDDELSRIVHYVLNNPVEVGLVDDARRWPCNWASWW